MDNNNMTPAKVIRRVRKRIEVSQEGLARLLNATKGAVQHWERGRNNPDLARLNALRQLCPAGAERKDLDTLIKNTQTRLAPLPDIKPGELGKAGEAGTDGRSPGGSYLSSPRKPQIAAPSDAPGIAGSARTEQLRILEDLATELQREMAKLKASQEVAPAPVASATTTTEG